MSKSDLKENRHFSRITFHADVEVKFDLAKETQSFRLLDISLKGALVEAAEPIARSLNYSKHY